MTRRLIRTAATVALASVAALAIPTAASAHPLGNFSVNQYDGLVFTPDGIAVSAALNTAELPTVQEKSIVDTDADGTVTGAERTAYATKVCADLATGLEVTVTAAPGSGLAASRIDWAVTPGTYEYGPGAGGLPTARLTCGLVGVARFDAPRTVTVVNRFRADRVGWVELTAAGQGVHLVGSPLPTHSVTDELRSYPVLEGPSSIVTVRTAVLQVAPGRADGVSVAAPPMDGGSRLTAATIWAEQGFERLAGGRLTPLLVVLTILVALLVGAGHAVLPGHGKTVLAAYLGGRDGRPRDAVLFGATVTASHTTGVLVIGLLLSTTTALAGERLLGYLGLASGLLIAAVGTGMVVAALRRGRPATPTRPEHTAHPDHGQGHSYENGHTHGHGHGHSREGHSHEHGHGHSHRHALHPHERRRLGLAGLGMAGGLVPSPSALVVLLAAVSLGRPVYGVFLVVVYGLGMAVTLTAAGLALVRVRRRLARSTVRLPRLTRLVRTLSPFITAAIVLVVGLGLAIRAGATIV